MAELKTRPTNQDVRDYLNRVDDETRRKDCFILLELMEKASGAKGVMWGESIIGCGSYHYKYASGREADWPLVGFSPRKDNLTLYIMSGFDLYDELLKKLGRHKTGKACLYLKKLSDVDPEVLKELIERSVEHMRKTNP
jgi:hypothetical protein